jgi:hypothetical protein
MPEKRKYCSKCCRTRPVTYFGKVMKDGRRLLQVWCRQCFAQYAKARRTRMALEGHGPGEERKLSKPELTWGHGRMFKTRWSPGELLERLEAARVARVEKETDYALRRAVR